MYGALWAVHPDTAQTKYSHVPEKLLPLRKALLPGAGSASFLLPACQLRMAPASRFTVRTECGEISPALRFLSGLEQLQFHGRLRTERKEDQRATAESKDPDSILTLSPREV